MDFLADPIFSVLDQADYIGGIDNEALDFGQLDDFMHGDSPTDATNSTNTTSSSNNNSSHLICHPKTEAPETPPINTVNDGGHVVLTQLATGRLHAGTASTPPIATPTLPTIEGAANGNNIVVVVGGSNGSGVGDGRFSQLSTQLPESPPDSSSEAPYSPLQDVHGLTLTSRGEAMFGGGGGVQHHVQQHHTGLVTVAGLNMPQQQQQQPFTPPHQQNYTSLQQPHAHNYPHSHPAPPTHVHAQGIRVKHEAGLIMNPANLNVLQQQQLQQQQSQSQMHNINNTHIEMPHTLLYGTNGGEAGGSMHPYAADGATGLYSNSPGSMYTSSSEAHAPPPPPASCILTTAINEAARVQVVGTTCSSSTSAPSTPVHLTSRKRKMSTQLDCTDYTPPIKPDPGILALSAVDSTGGITKLDPTSPVSIVAHCGSGVSDMPHSSSSSALLSPALSTINSNAENSLDGSNSSNSPNSSSGTTNGSESGGDGSNALTQCIRFSPFQPQKWHKLCDQSLQELSVVYYRVDADKGFNFSVSDDAFVCQKKNHFQITCHARLQGDAKFVKTPSGLEKIKSFHLHFYGVKLEAPNQTIRVEQSQSDRSKKPFYPVPIDLQSHIVSKVTVGRLHFSETTNNNMRKKGRPNPEQRYFQLVVGLHVHTTTGNFPVVSQGSERIIVRASNPGQFESDVDLCWQRGLTQDSIFHAGRVGINTDRPDESLVVHGNLKVSGHIVQPSDSRAKQEIGELDTSVQLRNLQKIRIVRYRYEPEFAIHSGLKRGTDSDNEEIVDTGVIAQEVREVIPDAVQEAGSIVLPNGNVIENFLLVNKDRILMENIGAVKELCKVTGSLETRIEHLERINNNTAGSKGKKCGLTLSGSSGRPRSCKWGASSVFRDGFEMCSNRALQIIIFLLIIVMAACLAAVSTLYFVEHNRQHQHRLQLDELQSSLHSSNRNNNAGNAGGGFAYHHFGYRGGVEPPLTLTSEQERLLQNFTEHLLWAATAGTPLPTAHNSSNNGTTKPHHELSYAENVPPIILHEPTRLRGGGTGGNDELTTVMEKPLNLQPLKEPYKATTTAPARTNNKTVSSKNKKWPLPQVVLRAATVAHNSNANTNNNHNNNNAAALHDAEYLSDSAQGAAYVSNVDGHNASEPPAVAAVAAASAGVVTSASSASAASAEKVALPQDFENNSIDIDAQHLHAKKTSSGVISAKTEEAVATSAGAGDALNENDASHEQVIADERDANIRLKLSEHIAASSTSSSNGIGLGGLVDVTARNNLQLVYKTVSPPTVNSARINENDGADGDSSGAAVGGAGGSSGSAGGGGVHTSNYSTVTSAPASITNKSRVGLDSSVFIDTADAVDLQNLSGSNNDSVDSPLPALLGWGVVELLANGDGGRASAIGRRSTSQRSINWLPSRTVYVEVLGTPAPCAETANNANCQSVCFENPSKLSPLRAQLLLAKTSRPTEVTAEKHTQYIDRVEQAAAAGASANSDATDPPSTEQRELAALPISDKQSHATQALAKQLDDDTNSSDDIADSSSSIEHLEELKIAVPAIAPTTLGTGATAAAKLPPLLQQHTSLEEQQQQQQRSKQQEQQLSLETPPSAQQHASTTFTAAADSWQISAAVIGNSLNSTIGVEEFRPSLSKSLNLTYIVPLSRFFRDYSIELHLTSSIPLVWTMCNQHEHVKEDGKYLIHTNAEPPVVQPQERQTQLDDALGNSSSSGSSSSSSGNGSGSSNSSDNGSSSSNNGSSSNNNITNNINTSIRQPNTTIVYLELPSQGSFVRDVALRATSDMEKENICEEHIQHGTNTLLQYNFRIVRDCD